MALWWMAPCEDYEDAENSYSLHDDRFEGGVDCAIAIGDNGWRRVRALPCVCVGACVCVGIPYLPKRMQLLQHNDGSSSLAPGSSGSHSEHAHRTSVSSNSFKSCRIPSKRLRSSSSLGGSSNSILFRLTLSSSAIKRNHSSLLSPPLFLSTLRAPICGYPSSAFPSFSTGRDMNEIRSSQNQPGPCAPHLWPEPGPCATLPSG